MPGNKQSKGLCLPGNGGCSFSLGSPRYWPVHRGLFMSLNPRLPSKSRSNRRSQHLMQSGFPGTGNGTDADTSGSLGIGNSVPEGRPGSQDIGKRPHEGGCGSQDTGNKNAVETRKTVFKDGGREIQKRTRKLRPPPSLPSRSRSI